MRNKGRKSLLLFWEGADWDLLNPQFAKGHLPNLRRLLDSGSQGSVVSIPPFQPVSVFVGAVTGRRVSQHMVTGHGAGPCRSPVFWENLDAPSLAINIPGQIEDSGQAGTLVWESFFNHSKDGRPGCSDAALGDDLSDLRVSPEDLDSGPVRLLCPNLTDEVAREDPLIQILADLLARHYSVHNVAASLLETETWELGVVRFDFLENVLRHFGRFSGEPSPDNPHALCHRYGEVVEGACRLMDFLLGELVGICGEDTNFFIASTRGRPVLAESAALSYPLISPGAGMFLAAGPGIVSGKNLGMVSLLDIAPTLAFSLGQVPDSAAGGRVLFEAFCGISRDVENGMGKSAAMVAAEIPDCENRSAEECFALGLDLYEAGATSEALPLLKMAARKNPERPVYAFWLACVQANLGQMEEAARSESVMLKYLEPEGGTAHCLSALLASQMGRHHQVVETLRKTMLLGELPPALHQCFVQALMKTKQRNEALDYLKTLARNCPSNAVELGLARCYLEFKYHAEAEVKARQVLESNPGLAEAYVILAEALQGSGQLPEAEAALAEAEKRAPDWPLVTEARARLFPQAEKVGRVSKSSAAASLPVDVPAGHSKPVYRAPEPGELARLASFLPVDTETRESWNSRIWCEGAPYPHFLGACYWQMKGNEAQVILRLAPLYRDHTEVAELIAPIVAEARENGAHRMMLVSSESVDWPKLLPGYRQELSVWTNEDWIGDPWVIADRLSRSLSMKEKASTRGWEVRSIRKEDWDFVRTWGREADYFGDTQLAWMQSHFDPDLSAVVEKDGRPVGLQIASRKGRQAVLEFIVGHPDHPQYWPVATLLMLEMLVAPAINDAAYDSLFLTTNLNRGKAMHRLAKGLKMRCQRRRFHALVPSFARVER